MRILWLSPYLPLPISGAGTRVFNLIKVLATTHEIDMIVNTNEWHERHEAIIELRALCGTLEVVPPAAHSHSQRRLLQVRSLISRRPATYWTVHSPQMQRRIDRALREVHYDVAILEHSFMGYYAIPDPVPTVLDQHNVESEILLRSGERDRSRIRRAHNLLEYWKYRFDEQRICRKVDLILAASNRDCSAMTSWGDMPPCRIVPNGVDTTMFVPVEHGEESERAGDVLFTGTLHYSPNSEALLYFGTEIWPLIQQRVAHATLTIVGANPPREIVQLGQLPGVTVTGFVSDVRPYLARAQVVVAPLRIGGGTRLKILEALAMGRAVVSTSLGAEGLEVQDGRHLLVADDPAHFAARVAELLADPARRIMLGREGRRLVEELYDWRAIGSSMEASLYQLLAESRASVLPVRSRQAL